MQKQIDGERNGCTSGREDCTARAVGEVVGEDWRDGECRDLREIKVKEKSVMTARVRTEPRREQTAAEGGCGSFTADIPVGGFRRAF